MVFPTKVSDDTATGFNRVFERSAVHRPAGRADTKSHGLTLTGFHSRGIDGEGQVDTVP